VCTGRVVPGGETPPKPAAINPPNSVYVFGTEEIAGTPAAARKFSAGTFIASL
jgi:hypothetical protein